MWVGAAKSVRIVLDSSRIKDLRTGYEVGNTKAVLDGDLDGFIEASLKQAFESQDKSGLIGRLKTLYRFSDGLMYFLNAELFEKLSCPIIFGL